MFEYKFFCTVIGLASLGLGLTAYQAGDIDSALLFFTVCSICILLDALVVVLSKQRVLFELAKWLFEFSVFCHVSSYNLAASNLVLGVALCVLGNIALAATIFLVLHVEMSKIKDSD